jgi:hypothetical protein
MINTNPPVRVPFRAAALLNRHVDTDSASGSVLIDDTFRRAVPLNFDGWLIQQFGR